MKRPPVLVAIQWFLLSVSLPFLSPSVLFGQDHLGLAEAYSVDQLKDIITPRLDWKPYPKAGEIGWQRVPDNVRNAHIEQGVQLLDTTWPPLPATVFLEYVRTGQQNQLSISDFQRRGQLASLVLAEVFEGKGRFLDEIVNGIWAIC